MIADEGNARYDSGIFLRAGSFNATKNLGPNRLITTGNPLCPSEILNVNATEIGATNYQWFENGIAIPGATNPIYNINHAGDFSVDITINANCTLTGSIQIEAAPALNINQDLYVQCDTNFDGLDTFNLVAIQNTLFTSLPTSFQIAFLTPQPAQLLWQQISPQQFHISKSFMPESQTFKLVMETFLLP